MTWAAANDHIVVTCDLDFAAILAASRGTRPSVLRLRSDILTPVRIGPSVLIAVRQAQQELLDGAVLSLDTGSGTIANPAAAT